MLALFRTSPAMKSSLTPVSLHLIAALTLVLTAAALPARTWTAADGRTLDADFVSASATAVTLKRAGGKPFTIELSKLSEADREFVAEQAKKPAEPAKPATSNSFGRSRRSLGSRRWTSHTG